MEQRELSEMEKVLQKTVEDLGQQVANLTIDLSLARSQIVILKEEQEAKKKNTKK